MIVDVSVSRAKTTDKNYEILILVTNKNTGIQTLLDVVG